MEDAVLCRLENSIIYMLVLGLSGKAQLAFAIVFSARYLDLLTSFVSVYNTVAKMVFIASSYATLYLMYFKFRATYDSNHDTFRLEFLVIPCAILSLIFNYKFTLFEVWILLTFRIIRLRFSGRFQSTLSPWQYCLSYLWFRKQETLKQSHHTIYSPLAHTEPCIFSIGSTASRLKATLTLLLSLLVSYKLVSTWTSFTYTLHEVCPSYFVFYVSLL